MNGMTFYNSIISDDRFSWLGVQAGAAPADDVAYVANRRGVKFEINISAIKDTPWDHLEAMLTEQRDPRVMTHITRIVGYYSQLQNWNASKLAELHDRHKGNYSVPASDAESASVQRIA